MNESIFSILIPWFFVLAVDLSVVAFFVYIARDKDK